MSNSKMNDLLNLQMNREFFNSTLYLSMATYFHSVNLDGFAHWMEQQAIEETGHAMRLYNYLLKRGARILLTAIKAPPTEWAGALAAFEDAYAHECEVSKEIDDLVIKAQAAKDFATLNFLQWFVEEQLEEEASVDAVVQKLKMAKDSPGPLFMLDQKLGTRDK